MIVAALVPVFGFLCVLSELFSRNKAGRPQEDLRWNEPVLDDAVYRSIHIRPDNDSSGIVPIEESLLFNSPKQRRKLLLNVLNLNPAEYVSSLRKAGINDDTEVVHYAVTALVELRKDYSEQLFDMDEKMGKSPSFKLLREYQELDEEYLATGLPEKGELRERIIHYDKILEQLYEENSVTDEKASLLRKRARCAMTLGNYESADRLLDRLIMLEPENEDNYLLKLQCLGAMKDRAGIDDVLAMISLNHVFLSEEGSRDVRFWNTKDKNAAV